MSLFQTDVAPVVVDGASLTVDALRTVAEQGAPIRLGPDVLDHARRGREQLTDLIRRGVAVEAVNSLTRKGSQYLIRPEEEAELQANLVRSHSTGVGPVFSEDETRAVVLALLSSLSKGYSAVRPVVLERLTHHLNHGVTPVVPEIGSLGSGGDTTSLAHVALALIGEGQVLRDGKRAATARVLEELGVAPLDLRFHEGRALLGGTSAMTGLGALVVSRALDQVRQAEIASALVTEAIGGYAGSCLPASHELTRPHRGQVDTATNLRELLRGGAAAQVGPFARQDAETHSLRAVPQILGAVRHTLYQAVGTLETELNSAGGDLLFLADQEQPELVHAANGHGQPVAFAMDFVTIALVQLGVLAERQLHRVLNPGPGSGLPDRLVVTDPALHHGFAGARYPASALVAENRTTIPASTQGVGAGDGHDVVSMGLLAVRGARKVLENNHRILAVEFLAAVQAVDVSQRFDALGPASQAACDAVRSLVPTLGVDRSMAGDIELIAAALSRGEILRAVGRYGECTPC